MSDKKRKSSCFGTREVISLITRLVMGFIFIYASWDKIQNPEEFYYIVRDYKLLPSFLEPMTAILLPPLELIVGVFLILGAFYRSSGLIVLGLMIAFEIGIVINLLRPESALEDCGCGLPLGFLGLEEDFSWNIVWRDMIFVVMAAEITFFSKPRMAIDQLFKRKEKEHSDK